jgi:hypothetical protein
MLVLRFVNKILKKVENCKLIKAVKIGGITGLRDCIVKFKKYF